MGFRTERRCRIIIENENRFIIGSNINRLLLVKLLVNNSPWFLFVNK